MNRTNEYLKLIHSSYIPQSSSKLPSFFLDDLFLIEKSIKLEIVDISNTKYESFSIRKKIKNVQKLIEDFKINIKITIINIKINKKKKFLIILLTF